MSEQIIAAYLDFVKDHRRLPTIANLTALGHSGSSIKHHFGNLGSLHRFVATHFAEILSEYIVSGATLFSEENYAIIDDVVKDYDTFFITTAVVNKNVDLRFLQSIKTWEKARDGKLLLMPCADVRGTRVQVQWGFDPALHGEVFINKETYLNDNVRLSHILVSAKQINPTTGLKRYARKSSCLLASPKPFLEYVPVGPSKERTPRFVGTTGGSITVNNYENDYYMSQRTSAIAEFDHVLGGVIVEVVDGQHYHMRHVRMAPDGSFVDLDKRYKPDGTVEPVRLHFYAGDQHAGDTDDALFDVVQAFLRENKVHHYFVGDFFNGHSISHHHLGRPGKQARKHKERRSNLNEELAIGIAQMVLIQRAITGTLFLIKGNHDEVLERYVEEGRYYNDAENHLPGLHAAIDAYWDRNVLEQAYRRVDQSLGGVVDWSRVKFLKRDESYLIGDVQMGMHGDKGANGSPPSLRTIEEAAPDCIVGHSHTPAIWRGVFRVGTFTKLNLDYNVGPSSWMHTGCLVTDDGERQLINFIDGKYKA